MALGVVHQPVAFLSDIVGHDSVNVLVVPVVALEAVTFILGFVGLDSPVSHRLPYISAKIPDPVTFLSH